MRKELSKFLKYLAILHIFFGILLMSYAVLHVILHNRAVRLAREQVLAFEPQTVTRPAVPTHIYIQWFVDTDIEPMPLINNVWGVSPNKATYLSQSARPGENGNIILYGHNTREILGNIRALQGGEHISITTSDGKTHGYTVSVMKEVDRTDVSMLVPTDTETLTIYTCSGPLDSRRFFIIAVPSQ